MTNRAWTTSNVSFSQTHSLVRSISLKLIFRGISLMFLIFRYVCPCRGTLTGWEAGKYLPQRPLLRGTPFRLELPCEKSHSEQIRSMFATLHQAPLPQLQYQLSALKFPSDSDAPQLQNLARMNVGYGCKRKLAPKIAGDSQMHLIEPPRSVRIC